MNSTGNLLERAKVAFEAHEYQKAQAILLTLTDHADLHFEVHYILGLCASSQGDFKLDLSLCQRAVLSANQFPAARGA